MGSGALIGSARSATPYREETKMLNALRFRRFRSYCGLVASGVGCGVAVAVVDDGVAFLETASVGCLFISGVSRAKQDGCCPPTLPVCGESLCSVLAVARF